MSVSCSVLPAVSAFSKSISKRTTATPSRMWHSRMFSSSTGFFTPLSIRMGSSPGTVLRAHKALYRSKLVCSSSSSTTASAGSAATAAFSSPYPRTATPLSARVCTSAALRRPGATNSVQAFFSTSAKASASGVQGRSEARRFSSQPTQSSPVTASASAPFSASFSRTCASFSAAVKPVTAASSRRQGVAGSAGRPSVHRSFTKSRLCSAAPTEASASP